MKIYGNVTNRNEHNVVQTQKERKIKQNTKLTTTIHFILLL